MSKAVVDVLAERKRQTDEEGWSEKHDDQHTDRSLALAGVCYARQYVKRAWLLVDFGDGAERYRSDKIPDDWPASWSMDWWKPKTPRRDLVRAAALLIDERIDREDSLAIPDRAIRT